MESISFDIKCIVDDIDNTGNQAEDKESSGDLEGHRRNKDIFRKDQCCENKTVFDPLLGAHCFQ